MTEVTAGTWMALGLIEILMVLASIAGYERWGRIEWIVALQFAVIVASFFLFSILVAGFG